VYIRAVNFQKKRSYAHLKKPINLWAMNFSLGQFSYLVKNVVQAI
jgi:hypothetical protein